MRVRERSKIDLLARNVADLDRHRPAARRPRGMSAGKRRSTRLPTRSPPHGARTQATVSCASQWTRRAATTRRTRSSRGRSVWPASGSTSSSSATRGLRRPRVPERGHVSVVHAPDVIGYDEEPAHAARPRTESSIVVGLRLVREGAADAFVSPATPAPSSRPASCTCAASGASCGRPSARSCRPYPHRSPFSTPAPTPSAAPSTCCSSPSWARPSPTR